ncbi:ABC transporter permease [Arthrobacter sp. I2-34]|uniref:ABC transporter permease n=1 Tax=Arthrobacter hankyongi TaxID=2904801 RepID=A0ABS9L5A7_9MICC|nr:ABC transporter permease [Arthrobacter hankyongi]MCG2621801.1 ABC transporter permease [Arthrobacter hankyongi]
MFLALRDIRFAKGRFLLMGSVIALMTLLLVLLSGLTAGLGNQSISVLRGLSAAGNTVVFGAAAGNAPAVSFTDSQLTAAQLRSWQRTGGVEHAEAFGVSQARLTAGGSTNVAVVGVQPGGRLAPAPVGDRTVVLSQTVADGLGAAVGDRADVGGRELEVSAVVADQWYSHTPVVWTSLHSWRSVAHLNGAGASGGPVATAAVVELADSGPAGAAAAAGNEAAGTVSTSVTGAYQGLGSYRSENGSLLLMQAFLYGICALVIVAFLSVWTIQRTRDIAVLKAMGGSDGYLLRDALAQAAVVLAAGAAVGGGAGVLGGMFAARAAPFLLTPANTLLPVAGIILLGMAGAVLAVRRVTAVDPLAALGGN